MYKSTSSSSPYALDTLLRQHYNTLSFKNSFLSRRYTTPREKSKFEHPIEDVAVLGGGITGLATAYYLAAKLPHAKITLFEGSSRLGGWLLSKTVNVGNGEVVFEQGPRNLRPDSLNGSVTLDLVRLDDLGSCPT